MKKVKVQYVAGSEVREAEIDNVARWDIAGSPGDWITLYNEDGDKIAEFVNCVSVIRV